MEPLFSVRSLSVEFVGRNSVTQVVKKLEFDLEQGQTLAIVGESGSGKSVSSLSFMQLLNSSRSNVTGQALLRYDKKVYDLIEAAPDQIVSLRGKAVSMIFQEPMAALNPVLTCGKQVAEIMLVHGTANAKNVKQKVLALFREVELPRIEQVYGSYPHELSGGQQQRVMIAMALANNPVLLIADEPTTALDPQVQENILDLISRLQKKSRMAMIFISHDLDVVGKIADRIIVMQRGEIMEQGPAEEVLGNPKHPYTRGLLNSKPGEHMRGLRLPTVKDFLENSEFTPLPLPPKEVSDFPVLELHNITVAYTSGKWPAGKQTVKAIDDITLALKKGETLGLIGPSGCGKTTTGRVISGWVRPTSGKVMLHGKTVITPSEPAGKMWARKVQLIFQDPFGSLNPNISIGDAIVEPMLIHGIARNNREAKAKTISLLEKTGLNPAFYSRYPHEFSGGQRQRIVIARALAVEPEVLVCDESVAALDVSVQSQVLNLLNDLQAELGLSMIFISHDHNVIRYFCDRILVMETGKIAGEQLPGVKGFAVTGTSEGKSGKHARDMQDVLEDALPAITRETDGKTESSAEMNGANENTPTLEEKQTSEKVPEVNRKEEIKDLPEEPPAEESVVFSSSPEPAAVPDESHVSTSGPNELTKNEAEDERKPLTEDQAGPGSNKNKAQSYRSLGEFLRKNR